MKLWPILTSVFGPGVAQALVGRRKAAIAFAAVFALAVCALAFTIHALAIAGGVWLVSIVDTIIAVARRRPAPPHRTYEAAFVWAALVVVAGVSRAVLAEAFKFPTSSMLPTLEIDDHVFASKLGGYERGDIVVFEHPCQPHDYGKRIVAIANDTIELRCNRLYLNGEPVEETLVSAATTYEDRIGGDVREVPASRYRQTIGGKTFEIFERPERPRQEAPDAMKDFPLAQPPSCAAMRGAASGAQRAGTIVDTKPGAAPCEPQRHYVVPPDHVFVLGDNRGNSNDSRFWGAVPVGNIKGKVLGIWRPLGRFGAL